MYTRLKAIYPKGNSYKSIDVFGYTTQGVPGIDVVGVGSYGKQVREKFIYISKVSKLEIPFRRYVLCVEVSENKLTNEQMKWLELPLFILFLSLSGQIPIKKLDDCFCSGVLSPTGLVYPLQIKSDALEQILNHSPGLKYIGARAGCSPLGMNLFPLEQIFEHIAGLRVRNPMGA